MDNLLNFFNTLLGIEVAVFGIISAVVLVFIQLVYSTYSYKHIGHILKNGFLISFFIFSAIDLIITSAGSYYLALNGHVFSPAVSLLAGTCIYRSSRTVKSVHAAQREEEKALCWGLYPKCATWSVWL